MEKYNDHKTEIIDQFSKQAIPFTKVPGHLDDIELLIQMAEVSKDDNVLDVACGPGLVVCGFAKYCEHVTGIDITPAMIKQAAEAQNKQNLQNISWNIGDAYPLPYPDNSFSIVVTRYSFHHFLDTEKALSEMIRVCKPGGKVIVADVGLKPENSEAYNKLEVIRDPSHTHALTIDEFEKLFKKSALTDCYQNRYGVDIELEAQLKASFPKEGDEQKIREMITNDIGINQIGINARRSGDQILYTVPIVIMAGNKR